MLHANLYPGVVRPIVSGIIANNTSTSLRSGTHSGRVGKFYPNASSTILDLATSARNTLNSLRSDKPAPPAPGGPAYVSSSGSSGSSGSSSRKIDYYEAPITAKYGFSKETAYQEALANTAYRREMADMRKAGLNPSVIYGSHNSSGAATNIYPHSSGSSGSSGFSGRSVSRGNSGKTAISGGLYYGAMAAVSAITAIATKNVGAGMMAGSIAGTALKALNGFLAK